MGDGERMQNIHRRDRAGQVLTLTTTKRQVAWGVAPFLFDNIQSSPIGECSTQAEICITTQSMYTKLLMGQAVELARTLLYIGIGSLAGLRPTHALDRK